MSIPIRLYIISRKMYDRRWGKGIAKFIWRLNRIIFSCEIDPSADISPSVKTPHNLLGCVIGSDVIIGENTKILHNVTIGGRRGSPEMPVIGKNVLIGVGAVILGGGNYWRWCKNWSQCCCFAECTAGIYSRWSTSNNNSREKQ